MKPQFKNLQLRNDFENLLEYDWLTITTDYDTYLGYIIDVNDSSYFYTNKEDRDFDDNLLFEETGF